MSPRSFLLLAAAVLAWQAPAQAQQVTTGASPAWPPTDAAAAAPSPGEVLFASTCARCHRAGGMGTGILSRRPGIPAQGLLEQREDLIVPFIQTVVRVGIGNMPRISRAEVSDTQLKQIAEYLAKGKK
jgi:mono/diheme cytochrome c family protein